VFGLDSAKKCQALQLGGYVVSWLYQSLRARLEGSTCTHADLDELYSQFSKLGLLIVLLILSAYVYAPTEEYEDSWADVSAFIRIIIQMRIMKPEFRS